jgi:hypothetical protein
MQPIIITLLPALLLAAAAVPSAAQENATVAESRVWFTGASNIRHFTCRAGEVYSTLELAPGGGLPALLAGDSVPAAATLRVPVGRLNCGIPLQNRHLRHTLKGDEHPSVEFTLDDYRVVPGEGDTEVRMLGRLAIAGVERPVELTGTLARDPAGTVRLRGAREIRVTDYGVRPPTRFLGLLRVRDRVTVHFDVALPPPAEVRVP